MKALMVVALAAAPVQAQRQCLTPAETEALTAAALPEIIRQAGSRCAEQLPETSLIRRASSPMLTRYEAEAERSWPAARGAIAKLSNPTAEALLGSSYARPLLASMVAPLIVGRIALGDCAMVDRVASQLEPLPPRNTAVLIATGLRYAQRVQPPAGQRNPVADLPLCPSGAR